MCWSLLYTALDCTSLCNILAFGVPSNSVSSSSGRKLSSGNDNSSANSAKVATDTSVDQTI